MNQIIRKRLWTPLNIRSVSVEGFFCALPGSQYTLNSSGSVSYFYDLSGKARHLTQLTSSKQPLFNSSNKELIFDGVDDVLETTSFTNYESGNSSTSVWMMGKTTQNSSTANYFGGYIGNIPANAGTVLNFSTAGSQGADNRYLTARFFNGYGITNHLATNDFIVGFQYQTSQGSSSIRVNSNNFNITFNNPSNIISFGSLGRFILGATYATGTSTLAGWLPCSINFALFLGGFPSSIECDKIEGWAGHAFGKTSLLPSSHPHKNQPPLI